jgi:hypothetical protein
MGVHRVRAAIGPDGVAGHRPDHPVGAARDDAPDAVDQVRGQVVVLVLRVAGANVVNAPTPAAAAAADGPGCGVGPVEGTEAPRIPR